MNARRVPDSIEELEQMLQDRILVEGRHVDFKREITKGQSGNKELAKDLAAFSIYGGHIIIGVDEADGGVVTPVPLAGLKERIDQVARTRVDPPVTVTCRELPSASDPEMGCLVVVVPPSPQAPHQAEKLFLGRSDTTNYVLGPGDIDRIYEQRVRRRQEIEDLLDEEIARDPTGPDLREQAHLFVAAEPENPDDDMFLSGLGGESFSTWLHSRLQPTMTGLPARWDPDVPASEVSRRARGWATHYPGITEERTIRSSDGYVPRERALLDVEVHENGAVRLFSTAASVTHGDRRVHIDGVVGGLVLRTVEIARCVASTGPYFGSWHFGVALTNLRGVYSSTAMQDILGHAVGYSEDSYRQTTSATWQQLEDPAAIAETLVARLMRGLQSPYRVPGAGD